MYLSLLHRVLPCEVPEKSSYTELCESMRTSQQPLRPTLQVGTNPNRNSPCDTTCRALRDRTLGTTVQNDTLDGSSIPSCMVHILMTPDPHLHTPPFY